MDLQYDIDIFYIMPPEAFSDPAAAAMMQGTGMTLNSRGNYIAKFRDPNTAAALSGASENVRAFFKASGFAFVPSGIKLPHGTFDQRFENHLTDVAKRMQENIHTFDLKDQDWNGFNLGTCILTIGQVKPVDLSVLAAAKAHKSPVNRPLWTRVFNPKFAFPAFAIAMALLLEFADYIQVSGSSENTRVVQVGNTDR